MSDVPFLGRHHLRAYGGTEERSSIEVFGPRSEDELLALIRTLRESGRSFAPLGACLSFDGQGLPDDVAISTDGFDRLEVDAARGCLIAGAGVRVGEALTAALAHGFVIPVLPSASDITVGGSVSANAYSRMTPGLGRESRHIRSIRVVTPDGTAHHCSRETSDDLFHACVGGFGLIGIITEVEYELTEIGDDPAFVSSAHAFDGVDGLVHLIPERPPGGLDGHRWPGSGSVIMNRGARLRTMLTRHRYESTPERRPTVAHQNGRIRLGVELLVRGAPHLASWVWERNWVPGKPVHFVDDVHSATFFMDANLRASRLLQRVGLVAPVLQQSYILPVDSRGERAAAGVETFVREAFARFREAGLTPSMFDVGFIPAAGPFLLAGNPERNAFLVSAAFLISGGVRPAAVQRVLGKLTSVGRTDYGGTIHLTKQAFCDDQVLREDYSEPIQALRALRSAHDPDGLLQTALGSRLGLT